MTKAKNKNQLNKILSILKSDDYNQLFNIASFKTRIASMIYLNRKEQDLTQQELADKSGTTKRIISNIENEIYTMGIDIFYRIWKALNLELISDNVDLMTGEKINNMYNTAGSGNKTDDFNWSENMAFWQIQVKEGACRETTNNNILSN
jgi:transcriptional regulator with XRE-family HTH domain